MADLVRDGDILHLRLSPIEKMEGLHGDVEVPLSHMVEVCVIDDVIHAVQGVKMPGSRLPGVLAIGTFESTEGTIFAVVHHQYKRGIRIRLREYHYDAIIVGVEHPEEVKQDLERSTKT